MSFSWKSCLLVSTGLFTSSIVKASPLLVTRDGPSPSLPYDPNVSKYCSWWVDVTSEYSCPTLLEDNFLTLEDFRRWNPSITADCGGLVVGNSYCVEAINEPPPAPSSSVIITSSTLKPTPSSSSSIKTTTSSTSTSTIITPSPTSSPPTTTKPSNGVSTPSPLQPSIAANCDAFYFVKLGDSCESIALANGISTAQFLAWNPSAGSSCTGLWADAYACVSIIGHTPTSATPSPTKPGNGIATPSPIQPGMVGNCDSFYMVKTGDTCDVVASANGISSAQIVAWNPAVGSGCTSLWLDTYICISILGHTPTPKPTPTPTKPGNGIATPTPYQAGMTTSCKSFHFVRSGDICATIADRYRITVANFINWNPAVGPSCGGLWLDTYVCVAVL